MRQRGGEIALACVEHGDEQVGGGGQAVSEGLIEGAGVEVEACGEEEVGLGNMLLWGPMMVA